MSVTLSDVDQELWYGQLYDEISTQALAEYKSERLKSYYLANREIAKPAVELLSEGRAVQGASQRATFALAASAAEVGIKALVLRPVVFGVVNSEALAGLIADKVVAHQGMDRLRDLLVGILREYAAVDLETFSRPGSAVPLWNEIAINQAIRNNILHRGASVSPDQAALSISVASAVLDTLFQQIISGFGLHLHDGYRICDDPHLTEDLELRLLRLVGGSPPENP